VTKLIFAAVLPAVLLPVVPSSTAPGGDRDGCFIVGEADPQQAARAMAACATSRQRLEGLFDTPAATVNLHFVPELPLLSFRVAKDTVEAFISTLPGGADRLGSFQQWEMHASHEIAHALYDARTGTLHTKGPGNGDWFMEAVAIWAEHDADRQRRIDQAANEYRHVLDLPSVLRMQHPMHGTVEVRMERIYPRVCRGVCPGMPDTPIREVTRADGVRTVDTLTADSPILAHSRVALAFYATSFAVLQFVHERGGSAAVRLIEERLRAGAGVDALNDVPGLPPVFEEFRREWESWLDEAARRKPPASIRASGSKLPAAQQ
jgi:hypothetical protein